MLLFSSFKKRGLYIMRTCDNHPPRGVGSHTTWGWLSRCYVNGDFYLFIFLNGGNLKNEFKKFHFMLNVTNIQNWDFLLSAKLTTTCCSVAKL